jgi:hypothetical protein
MFDEDVPWILDPRSRGLWRSGCIINLTLGWPILVRQPYQSNIWVADMRQSCDLSHHYNKRVTGEKTAYFLLFGEVIPAPVYYSFLPL